MRDQLIRYVDLLFAGITDTEDIKQEILQNTLDRFDDLVAQGKTEEAAYQLSTSGIGDIREILGTAADTPASAPVLQASSHSLPLWKKILRAAAVFLYIIAVIPLIILSEMNMSTIGLCGTLAIVAAATVLIVLSGSSTRKVSENVKSRSKLSKAVDSVIFAVGLCGYFIVSFASGAWHITWVIFLIIVAAQGLARAIFDLKEGC